MKEGLNALAKVTLKGVSPQKVWGKDIAGRLHVDLHAPGKKLSRDYDEHLSGSDGKGGIAGRLTNLVARKVEKDVRAHYNRAITDIQSKLNAGIEGGRTGETLAPPQSVRAGRSSIKGLGWKALSKRYYKRKIRKSKNFFWRNTGSLSAQFGSFAGTHKSAVTRKSADVVTLTTKGKQAYNRRYRYNITFELPVPHTGEGYFKELLQFSFFEGKPYEGKGYGLPEGGLAVLGYLEGTPSVRKNKYRPFIAKVMASRGLAFRKIVERSIRNQVI